MSTSLQLYVMRTCPSGPCVRFIPSSVGSGVWKRINRSLFDTVDDVVVVVAVMVSEYGEVYMSLLLCVTRGQFQVISSAVVGAR